jgi:hypothetical protein
MSKLVKLYPPAWRRRYGAELEEAANASPGWKTRIDLVRGAIDAWSHSISPYFKSHGFKSEGGGQLTQEAIRPGFVRVSAVLMVLPLFFLGMNLKNELTGTDGLIFEWFFASTFGELVVVLGPFLAICLLVLPAVKVGFDRGSIDGGHRGPVLNISVRFSRSQVLTLAVAAVTATAFLGYFFLENFVARGA